MYWPTLRRLIRSYDNAFVALLLSVSVGVLGTLIAHADAAAFRALPYRDSRALFLMEGPARAGVSLTDVERWTATGLFSDLAAYRVQPNMVLTGTGGSQRLQIAAATDTFFTALGASALLGRGFGPGDGPHVIVLTHEAWSELFAGAADVVGRPVTLSGTTYVVIGVMPRGADFPQVLNPRWTRFDGWIPLDGTRDRSAARLRAIVRLQPGATPDRAMTQLTADGGSEAGRPVITPLRTAAFGPLALPLGILATACLFTLVLACLSIAALKYAAADARRREAAVCVALGATLRRRLTDTLTEIAVLSLAIAPMAMGVFWIALTLLTAYWPADLPRVGGVALDLRYATLLWATGAAAVFVSCGLPILSVQGPGALQALASDAKGTTGRSGRVSRRVRAALVAGQIGIAVCAIALAGSLAWTLGRLLAGDRGFDSSAVTTARLTLPSRIAGADAMSASFDRLLQDLDASPVVGGAALSTGVPGIRTDGTTVRAAAGASAIDMGVQAVSDDYYTVLRIPLVSGRTFDARDTIGAAPAVVIDTAAARRLGAAGSIGARVLVGSERSAQEYTVIGVVQAVKHAGAGESERPHVYVALRQTPLPSVLLIARPAGKGPAPSTEVATAVRRWLPDAPAPVMQTLDDLIAAETAHERFGLFVLSACAVLALAVSLSSVSAFLAYQLLLRRREMAIRLSLGATPKQALDVLLGPLSAAVGTGALAGTAAFFLGAQVLAATFRVPSPTVWAPLASSLMVIVCAALTMVLPARTFLRSEPARLLRD